MNKEIKDLLEKVVELRRLQLLFEERKHFPLQTEAKALGLVIDKKLKIILSK